MLCRISCSMRWWVAFVEDAPKSNSGELQSQPLYFESPDSFTVTFNLDFPNTATGWDKTLRCDWNKTVNWSEMHIGNMHGLHTYMKMRPTQRTLIVKSPGWKRTMTSNIPDMHDTNQWKIPAILKLRKFWLLKVEFSTNYIFYLIFTPG